MYSSSESDEGRACRCREMVHRTCSVRVSSYRVQRIRYQFVAAFSRAAHSGSPLLKLGSQRLMTLSEFTLGPCGWR